MGQSWQKWNDEMGKVQQGVANRPHDVVLLPVVTNLTSLDVPSVGKIQTFEDA